MTTDTDRTMNTESDTDRVDPVAAAEEADIDLSGVPEWDDTYLDRVSDRLLFNYDLTQNKQVNGETFNMYAEMRLESHKHFFHPALDYANHETHEHVFVTQIDRPHVETVERFITLGHDLSDDSTWLDPDEEHFGTEFTFVVIAETVPESVESFVSSFRDRNLLKFGYYGHYEIHLIVVAPDRQEAVASEQADTIQAFTLWQDVTDEQSGLISRIRGMLNF
ncbi:hypothetical protein [Haloquadratum walsbyi]|jgi:hypothetical protein|uniref:DUF8052 domain-containing protein n=2 Tax=Haloquadratum walsbyi TaxID=293091 RepID=Q18DK0_HALWD|nr:hypothetical protein [Haloquadratum walsbyi]ABC72347.1 conserved hypothetical protein [Haloquadratum walsbyi]CAJ51167.1 uncharacterized protein HQ_1037A [Haloquadratum walsbyi DSM 16790]